MRRITLTVLVLASSVGWAGRVRADDLRAEFKQYYERKGYPESWTAAMNDLGAADERKWRPAAAILLAVLEQSRADEADGTSPWRATPYWGSPAENPARELRGHLLRELIGKPAKPGAVPLIRWYLFENPVLGHPPGAMLALRPIATPEANALRLELLRTRPENAWVLAAALRQAREQKLAVGGDVLAEFATHHRPSIRSIAREWLRADKKPVPAFDPAKAVRAAPVKDVVAQITALWPDVPAAAAAPLSCSESYLGTGGEAVTTSEFVWPLGESKTELRTVDLHGRLRTFDLASRNRKPANARETTWRTDPADVEAEVRDIAKLRAEGDPDFALSARGGLTGQFEGGGPTLKELLLGVWLDRAGRHELAATLLLPAIDAAPTDAAVVEVARQRLAVVYGQEMLRQFTYLRNYAEALRLARLTQRLYPKTTYSEHAERLARELPLRGDDFRALSLPTAKEWAALKPTLGREKQIDYLCARLRLLNCFQHSQPGGVDYHDPQFKEPGIHWRPDDGATAVINPLTELAGHPGNEWRTRPKADGLKLTLADVPVLAAHLKDDWTMVMVSYWWDFDTHRALHTTPQALAGIIGGLAKQDLCRVKDMARMSPKETETHILAIQRWAADRRGKSDADLHVEALEKAVRDDKRWPWNAEDNALVLVKLGDRRVIAPALKFLQRTEVDEYDFSRILKVVAPLDPAAFRSHALKMLGFQGRRDQLWAACLLVAADEPKVAFDKIETLVSDGSFEAWSWSYALEVLLAAKSDRAKSVVSKIISGKRFLDPSGDQHSRKLRHDYVLKLYTGGYREDVLRTYDALLDDDTPGRYAIDKDYRNSHGTAAEIIEFLKDADEGLRTIADKPGKPGEKIPDLKRWIATKLAEPKK